MRLVGRIAIFVLLMAFVSVPATGQETDYVFDSRELISVPVPDGYECKQNSTTGEWQFLRADKNSAAVIIMMSTKMETDDVLEEDEIWAAAMEGWKESFDEVTIESKVSAAVGGIPSAACLVDIKDESSDAQGVCVVTFYKNYCYLFSFVVAGATMDSYINDFDYFLSHAEWAD